MHICCYLQAICFRYEETIAFLQLNIADMLLLVFIWGCLKRKGRTSSTSEKLKHVMPYKMNTLYDSENVGCL